MQKYEEVFSGIVLEIKTLNGGKELFYEKSYSRSGVILLKKQLKFSTLTLIIRCALQKAKNLFG